MLLWKQHSDRAAEIYATLGFIQDNPIATWTYALYTVHAEF